MKIKNNLIKKIKHKKAVVGIIGLGYVGLPLALACCKKGFKTIGFDIDKYKVKKINLGISYIKQIKNINLPKKKNYLQLIILVSLKIVIQLSCAYRRLYQKI